MKFFIYVKRFVTSPSIRMGYLSKLGFYNHMSDERYLKKKFKVITGKSLDLDNPKTFNEKLQWLKLNDRKPKYTMMVDKYKVREYISQKIGSQYLVPLLGVWDDPDEIEFETLPEQFVLKCNHNSGTGMCICKDKSKIDVKKIKADLRKGLKEDYYIYGREWPYKDVPRKIIAEKYMEDSTTSELRDYKFFCFGGVCKCYKIDYDRFTEHKANYYTADGEHMKLGEKVCPPDFNRKLPIPHNFQKMKQLAEVLSAGQPFLRVDFYNVDGRVYFGELTFFPASGFGEFIYKDNDETLGSWIKLPENITNCTN